MIYIYIYVYIDMYPMFAACVESLGQFGVVKKILSGAWVGYKHWVGTTFYGAVPLFKSLGTWKNPEMNTL